MNLMSWKMKSWMTMYLYKLPDMAVYKEDLNTNKLDILGCKIVRVDSIVHYIVTVLDNLMMSWKMNYFLGSNNTESQQQIELGNLEKLFLVFHYRNY